MMILFVGSNLYLSRINSQQLEATMYMNQYRLGSKTLTAAVQPYAVTGDKTYYNNMKDLHEDKNCDIAWDLKSLPKNMSMASYTFPTVFITILYIFPTL